MTQVTLQPLSRLTDQGSVTDLFQTQQASQAALSNTNAVNTDACEKSRSVTEASPSNTDSEAAYRAKIEEHKARIARSISGFYARLDKDPRLRASLEEERAYEIASRTRRRKPTTKSEYAEQKIVCEWMSAYGIRFASNQEGTFRGWGRTGARHTAIAKAAGMKSGRPDLEVFSRVPLHPEARGCAIEMKRVGGRGPTPAQVKMHKQLSADGWLVHVAYGSDDAIRWLQSLGFGGQK